VCMRFPETEEVKKTAVGQRRRHMRYISRKKNNVRSKRVSFPFVRILLFREKSRGGKVKNT